LLGDSATDAALNIDPILQSVGRDLQRLGELGLELRYVLETPGISTASPMPATARRPTRAVR
jgi:hypothetical protein